MATMASNSLEHKGAMKASLQQRSLFGSAIPLCFSATLAPDPTPISRQPRGSKMPLVSKVP